MWPPVEMFLFALLVCVYAVDAGSVTQKAVKSSTEEPADSYDYLRCWRCDYDDADQCVKNFDFTKHKHEACDGKCLKAYEKTEARTKVEIEKAQSKHLHSKNQHRIFRTQQNHRIFKSLTFN